MHASFYGPGVVWCYILVCVLALKGPKCLVFPHILCEAVGYMLVKVIHYMGLEHWFVYSFACLACILVLQCFEHCFLLLPYVVNRPVHLTVSLFHSVVCSVVLSVSQVSLIGRQSGSEELLCNFLQQWSGVFSCLVYTSTLFFVRASVMSCGLSISLILHLPVLCSSVCQSYVHLSGHLICPWWFE